MLKTHTVAAAFSTPMRRFTAGEEISAADLDGELGLTDWERLGKVKPLAPKAEKPKRSAAASSAE